MQMLTPEAVHPYKQELKILWIIGVIAFIVLAVSTTIACLEIFTNPIPRATANSSMIVLVVDMLVWAFLSELKFPRRNHARNNQLIMSATRLARDKRREKRA